MGTLCRSRYWVLIFLACLGLFGIGSAFADSRRPKNVQVALRAKWQGTPLLLEAGYVGFAVVVLVSNNLIKFDPFWCVC